MDCPVAQWRGREDILSPLPPTPHRLHPMTATACTSALRYAIDNNLWSRAKSVERWFEAYRGKLEDQVLVRRVQGVGAMYGIEVGAPAGFSSQSLANEVRAATLEQGLLMWECGADAVVIGLIPPLMVTENDVDDACKMIRCRSGHHRRATSSLARKSPLWQRPSTSSSSAPARLDVR